MTRTVAGRRGDFEDKPAPVDRGYKTSLPLHLTAAVDYVCKWLPRAQAVAAVAIAKVHGLNAIPVPGGLANIRYDGKSWTIEERITAPTRGQRPDPD